jgi:hypothetical protein
MIISLCRKSFDMPNPDEQIGDELFYLTKNLSEVCYEVLV